MISGTAGVGNTPVESPMTHTQQTLLFPSLVKKINPDRRLSVLEIGPVPSVVSQDKIELIGRWISQGAQNN